MSRRFKILTIAVFAAGIATALAAGGAGIWAWQTAGTLLVFRIALPALTIWMLVALMRLALALRRSGCDAARPDVEFCRQIELPPEPGSRWWQRRRRLALQIEPPDGPRRYVVGPARLVARHRSAGRWM